MHNAPELKPPRASGSGALLRWRRHPRVPTQNQIEMSFSDATLFQRSNSLAIRRFMTSGDW